MSGRPRTKSGVVDDCLVIEVGELVTTAFTFPERNTGRLAWRCAWSREEVASAAYALELGPIGDLRIRLTFTAEASASVTGQLVKLEITQPFFGGSRYWFICPGADEDRGC